MLRKLGLLFLSLALCYPAFALSTTHHTTTATKESKEAKEAKAKETKAAKADKPKTVRVKGYTKKDGTYVAPYSRSETGTAATEGASTSTYHEYHEFSHYRSGHLAEGYTADSSVRVSSHGKIKRSGAAKDAFKREQPCPSTGKGSGGCPGYVIDHVDPLECGGPDAPSNMQWQTIADGKAKDKTERLCRH
jgi:hypothetical protein